MDDSSTLAASPTLPTTDAPPAPDPDSAESILARDFAAWLAAQFAAAPQGEILATQLGMRAANAGWDWIFLWDSPPVKLLDIRIELRPVSWRPGTYAQWYVLKPDEPK